MSADNDIVRKLEATQHALNALRMPASAKLVVEAAAEIGRLRGEVENITAEAIEWRDKLQASTPAPAMPNGVEGLVAQLRGELAHDKGWNHTEYEKGRIAEKERCISLLNDLPTALRAADNRDAAGVDRPAPGDCSHYFPMDPRVCVRCGWDFRTGEPPTPAAVPAGEAVAYSVVQIGNRGAAYDPPNTHRAFTYEHQPGNIDASRLGRATNAAAVASAGDSIDRGLSLLKELQALGFGVFQIGPPSPKESPQPADGEAVEFVAVPDDYRNQASGYRAGWTDAMNAAPVQAAPQEGEAGARALRYTHFQIVTPEGLAPLVGPSAFIEGKYAIQDHRSARVVAWASERETAVSICYAINNPTGDALGAVRIDDAMIQRGCDAYSAKRMEETGEGESYPEGMQAALTAALQHRGDSRGGEGSGG